MKIFRHYCVALAISSSAFLHAQVDSGLDEYSHYDDILTESYQIAQVDDFLGDDLFIEEDLNDLDYELVESELLDVYSYDNEDILIGGFVEDDNVYLIEEEYIGEGDFIDSEIIEGTTIDCSSDALDFYYSDDTEDFVGYYDNLEFESTSLESEEYIDEEAEDHIIYRNRRNRYTVGDFFLETAVCTLVMMLFD